MPFKINSIKLIILYAVWALVGIIYFLFRQFELKLNQELEKYKIDYSALTNQRAEAIREIYQLIVRIQDTQIDHKFGEKGRPYPGNYKNKDGIDVHDGQKYSMTVDDSLLNISNSLYSLYHKNKIYFSPTTCTLFDELISNLHTFWESFGQKQIFYDASKNMRDPYEYQDLSLKMGMTIDKEMLFIKAGENIKKLKLEIEEEFRNLLSIK